LFGVNEPDGNARFVSPFGPAPAQPFSTGKLASSSRVRLNRLLLLQPVKSIGTPGLSKKVTLVPCGDVRVNFRSPTQAWFMPTVVEVGSALAAVPSKRKFRSFIYPKPLTGSTTFTPAGVSSGTSTAGPV
jgi:hypothetical protein